ncbi:MAG: hypothetical protein RR101_13245 [Burkholderiaceae bacterium]
MTGAQIAAAIAEAFATDEVAAVVAGLLSEGERLIKGIAFNSSADTLENLAESLEAGEELTPRKLRAVARDLREEANK